MNLMTTSRESIRRVFYLVYIFLSLYSDLPAQTFQSAFSAGGQGGDVGQNLAVDNQGNIFISGFFSSLAFFDSTPLFSNGCYDPFLVKMNNDGEILWAKGFGNVNCDYSNGLCIDNDQNVYVAGMFQIELSIGDTILSCEGDSDVFIAKFDNDGNFTWAKTLAGSGADACRNLKHKDGNIYMTGSFSDTARIDNIELISAGKRDVFLLKMDTTGNVIWVKQGGGPDFDTGGGVDLDESNNVYLAGRYGDSATFGSFETESNGQDDVFICKYNQDGTEQWLKAFGSTSNDFSGCLTVDRFGNSYFTGDFNGDFLIDMEPIAISGPDEFLLFKFDSNGNLQWVRKDECEGQCAWRRFIIDDFDNIFLNGMFSEQAIFDGDTITAIQSGYYKACYAQMDKDGNLNWLKHSIWGSCSPTSIQTLNDSTLIVTGEFTGTVDFDDMVLTSVGDKDIFLATLSNGLQFNHPLTSDLLLYPNPTNHSITLEFKDSQTKVLSIFSSSGSLVYKGLIQSEVVTIDVSTWGRGLYFLHVQGENYRIVSKFIKE